MNIVKISGSVGEQLFQYAFFMCMRRRHPDTLPHFTDSRFTKMFPLLPCKDGATAAQVDTLHKSLKGSVKNLLKGTRCTGKDYKDQGEGFDTDAFSLTETYFDGSWLSHRYPDSIAAEVAKAFTVPANMLSKGAQNIISMLEKKTESVAIHIHRPTSNDNTCTSDYYNWAIAHIRHFIEEPFFVIITDDEKWTRSHLLLDEKEHICISAEAHHHFSIIPLFCHAKHNITANTLESWWATWLNPNPDKIVIVPQKWSRNETFPHLIPLHWISVPTT